MNKTIVLIAKIAFAIPFAFFGVNHFIVGANMSGAVPSFIPGGVFWIYFTGLSLIAAAVSLLINVKTQLAMRLLALMMLIFVLTIHLPGIFNPSTAMMSTMGLFKDLALGASALLFGEIAGKKTN
jgi:putative oxidoreductase